MRGALYSVAPGTGPLMVKTDKGYYGKVIPDDLGMFVLPMTDEDFIWRVYDRTGLIATFPTNAPPIQDSRERVGGRMAGTVPSRLARALRRSLRELSRQPAGHAH